ncbi:hypothetical protein ACHAXS_007572 [Conticribra weissflogii]
MTKRHESKFLRYIRRLRHETNLISLVALSFIAITTIFYSIFRSRILSSSPSHEECLVSHGRYKGSIYQTHQTQRGSLPKGANSGETISNKCLVESPWMRLAQHTVKLPPNANNDSPKVIDDWLWIDYHDRINVLVEDPDNPSSFLILQQTKYALDSEMSLAVVGGIIEPTTSETADADATSMAPKAAAEGEERDVGYDAVGESPLSAAQREVKEELNVSCRSWTTLGKFRTDVNRGMGWVHPFLARDCDYSSIDSGENNEDGDAVGAHDTELQKVRSMALEEVRVAVMEGKFLEVQWSNTVALAMLHIGRK